MSIVHPVPNNQRDKITMQISDADFNKFFFYLSFEEPTRIVSVSDYQTQVLWNEKITLSPADVSTTVITFKNVKVTFYKELGLYGTSCLHLCYLMSPKDEVEFHKEVLQEIVDYRPKADLKKNEIIIQECTLKTSLTKPKRVKITHAIEDLCITNGIAQNCIRYIDSCIEQEKKEMNLMISGEYETGKMTLVKALAHHYNKPLTLLTVRADVPYSSIRDNIYNGSIICFRDADLLAHNGPALSLVMEMLKSDQFQEKKCIVIFISYQPRIFIPSVFSYTRIGHIAKLEPPTKNEIKDFVKKMVPAIEEETIKSFLQQISHKSLRMGAISAYVKRNSEDLLKNIDELVGEQYKVREEIVKSNTEKLYS